MKNISITHQQNLKDMQVDNPAMYADYIKCIDSNVALTSWIEDVSEAEDDINPYPYTREELEAFLGRYKLWEGTK